MSIAPTDAVLTGIDELATAAPHLVFVVTSNFVRGLDEAFLSRADTVIEVPLPNEAALEAILRDVLRALGEHFRPLAKLSNDAGLREVAAAAKGLDGRQARKLVARALARHAETAADPGRLSLDALRAEASEARRERDVDKQAVKRVRAV